MAFTQEIVDFTGLTDPKIRTKLEKLNIPLTVEETLKIQNDMLGRAPSLAERLAQGRWLVSRLSRVAALENLVKAFCDSPTPIASKIFVRRCSASGFGCRLVESSQI